MGGRGSGERLPGSGVPACEGQGLPAQVPSVPTERRVIPGLSAPREELQTVTRAAFALGPCGDGHLLSSRCVFNTHVRESIKVLSKLEVQRV